MVLGLVAAAVACSKGDDATTSDEELSSAKAGRWVLPKDVAAIGVRTRLAYDDAPAWSAKSCTGKLKSGANKLGEYLRDNYGAVKSVGGYACRPNTANKSQMSVHGTGRALDVFIPKTSGGANNTKGDPVANFLVENGAAIGVQLVIWDRTIWQANGKNDKAYGGPHPHDDHIHVELTEEAAAMKTAWFKDPSGVKRDGGTSEAEQDEKDTPDDEEGKQNDEKDQEEESPRPGSDTGGATPGDNDPGPPEPEEEDPPPPSKPLDPNNTDPNFDAGTTTSDAGTSSKSKPPPSSRTTPSHPGEDPDDDQPGAEDSLESKSTKKPEVAGVESSGCTSSPKPNVPFTGILLTVAFGVAISKRRRSR